jgi:hypothetical protein
MHIVSKLRRGYFPLPICSKWIGWETTYVVSQFSIGVNVVAISLRPRNRWCKVGNIWNVLSATWRITGHALTAERQPPCCILNWHEEKHFDVNHIEVLLQIRLQPQFTVMTSYFCFRGSSVVTVTFLEYPGMWVRFPARGNKFYCPTDARPSPWDKAAGTWIWPRTYI